jgi:hypothetical protein
LHFNLSLANLECMDVKEFARLGGKARAKKLGAEALKAHARKMVDARKLKAASQTGKDDVAGDNTR